MASQRTQRRRRDLSLRIRTIPVAVAARLVEHDPVVGPRAVDGRDRANVPAPAVGERTNRCRWVSDAAYGPVCPKAWELGVVDEHTITHLEDRYLFHDGNTVLRPNASS